MINKENIQFYHVPWMALLVIVLLVMAIMIYRKGDATKVIDSGLQFFF